MEPEKIFAYVLLYIGLGCIANGLRLLASDDYTPYRSGKEMTVRTLTWPLWLPAILTRSLVRWWRGEK